MNLLFFLKIFFVDDDIKTTNLFFGRFTPNKLFDMFIAKSIFHFSSEVGFKPLEPKMASLKLMFNLLWLFKLFLSCFQLLLLLSFLIKKT